MVSPLTVGTIYSSLVPGGLFGSGPSHTDTVRKAVLDLSGRDVLDELDAQAREILPPVGFGPIKKREQREWLRAQPVKAGGTLGVLARAVGEARGVYYDEINRVLIEAGQEPIRYGSLDPREPLGKINPGEALGIAASIAGDVLKAMKQPPTSPTAQAAPALDPVPRPAPKPPPKLRLVTPRIPTKLPEIVVTAKRGADLLTGSLRLGGLIGGILWPSVAGSGSELFPPGEAVVRRPIRDPRPDAPPEAAPAPAPAPDAPAPIAEPIPEIIVEASPAPAPAAAAAPSIAGMTVEALNRAFREAPGLRLSLGPGLNIGGATLAQTGATRSRSPSLRQRIQPRPQPAPPVPSIPGIPGLPGIGQPPVLGFAQLPTAGEAPQIQTQQCRVVCRRTDDRRRRKGKRKKRRCLTPQQLGAHVRKVISKRK